MAFEEKEGIERRKSLAVLQYWNELRGDRPFPSESEIDPDHLGDIWGHCFWLQIRDVEQVRDYNFTYLGVDLVRAYDDGVLDRLNGKMVTPDAHRSAALFSRVLEQRDPLLDEGEYINSMGKKVKFRQIMMPIGQSNGEINAILGGAWFGLFEK